MGTWLCLKTVSHESAESSLWWLNSSQWQTQVVLTLTSRTADQSWFNPNPLSASFQQAKGKMVSRKMTTRTQSGLTVAEFCDHGALSSSVFPPWLGRSGSAAGAHQLLLILLSSAAVITQSSSFGSKLWLKGLYLTGNAPPAQWERAAFTMTWWEGSVGIMNGTIIKTCSKLAHISSATRAWFTST